MSTESQDAIVPPQRKRLEGWKEIAWYLGKTTRTAQRLEKREDLPVCREREKVFAYSDEIDRWRAGRIVEPERETAVESNEKPPETTANAASVRSVPWIAVGIGAALMLAIGIHQVVSRIPAAAEQRYSPKGRLLVHASSEGRAPVRIELSDKTRFLAISPDGGKLFAIAERGRILFIVGTKDGAVRTLDLPQEGGPLASSSHGQLYISSSIDGIMEVDIARERLTSVISTGGPVLDLAITPDGEKIFLAMSESGVKRFSARTGKVDVISDRICPEGVAVDAQGRRLYVAYQCGGPSGKAGHDSVEIFDARKEISLGIVNGPPMVGEKPSVSPDGSKVMLDGTDACSNPGYDHAGCASFPSRVFHLLRPADQRIVKSLEYPKETAGPVRFLDDTRFLVLGNAVTVVDAARYTVRERLILDGDVIRAVAPSPNGRDVYFGDITKPVIWKVEAEDAACSIPQDGLAVFYAVDGSFDDTVDVTALVPHGGVRFSAGKVGQALSLDGTGYLSAPWMGHFKIGFSDWSLGMYVKFAAVDAEMTVLDWVDENPRRGIRLLKSADNRIVFESWPGGSPLISRTVVRPETWYHLSIARADDGVRLYVNGQFEAAGTPSQRRFAQEVKTPLYLGARAMGASSLHGWLDEIAFYSRALSSAQVKAAFDLRESGPCKP